MFSIEKKRAKLFADRLKNLLGENLVAVVALGSRVRGDHTDVSDLDILVIVRRRTFSLVDRVNRMLAFDGEGMGLPFSISVSVKDIGSFEKEKAFNTSFYRSILREGVVLYGKT